MTKHPIPAVRIGPPIRQNIPPRAEKEQAMSALRARPFEGFDKEPPKKGERSIFDALRTMGAEKSLDWPEVSTGARGADISRCRFQGLRDLTVDGADTAGGYLRPTSQPTTAIEALQALLVCTKAGAQTVPVTEFSPIPLVVSAGEGYWVVE